MQQNLFEEVQEMDYDPLDEIPAAKPPKKKKQPKAKTVIAIIIALALLGTAGYLVYKELFPNNEPIVKMQTHSKKGTIDWNKLLAMNPDTVGWLKIPHSTCDTPVVQTTDNSFYLSHNFKKQYDIHGTPFLDKDYQWGASQNSVIYGHSIFRDGFKSQFDVIHDYLGNQKYFNKHRTVYYHRPKDKGGYGKWKVFAVILVDPDYNYRQPTFSTSVEFHQFLDGIEKKNTIVCKDMPKDGDEILTLSTCQAHVKRVALMCYRTRGYTK